MKAQKIRSLLHNKVIFQHNQVIYLMVCHLILFFSSASAQDYRKINQYTAHTWTIDQGLPNTGILDVLQDQEGFIWVGTYGGVARFDGVYFENYADIFPERKLIYSAICQGTQDRLWLGSGNGLFFFRLGRFKKAEGRNGLSPYVESLMSEESGRVWIGTRSDGIYYYENETFTKVKEWQILDKAFISDIVAGKNGDIWFCSPELGVFRLNGEELDQFTEFEGLSTNYVNGLHYDQSEDRLWACTSSGLNILENNEFTTVPDLEGIDCIHINQHDGYFYVSTSLGLYVLDGQGNIVDKYIPENSPQLVTSRFDQEGNIWLAGYRSGLTKLSPKKFEEYSQLNELDGNAINTILEVAEDSIFMANDLGVVFNMTPSGFQKHPISTITKDQRIRDLYKDQSNDIWVSTYNGVYRFSEGQVDDYQLLNDANILANNSTRFTQQDSQGNYWIGSRTGLFKMDSTESVQVFTKNDSLSSDFILRVFEGKYTKDIWIGTAGGGINVLRKDGTIENLLEQHGTDYNVVFSFYQSQDSSIWITHNGGLSRYYQGAFQTDEQLFALENNNIFEIEEDELGYFWLSTGEGIIRVNKDTLKHYLNSDKKPVPYDLFDKSDGILNSSATPNANIMKDFRGNLWFPMVYGVLKVNPNQIPKNELKPPVYITNIVIDGEKQYPPFSQLKIPRESKRIQIDYTALSYQATEKVRFKCKLVGYDEDWVDMGDKRFIEYTNLSPGTYTFLVIAANNDGVWNMIGDSLALEVKAAFYETRAFYAFMIILLLIIVYLYFRFRTYQIRSRNHELTKQVALRTVEIQEKVEELEQQNEEISIANETINEINNSLQDTLNLVQHQKDSITSSITYAQRIQEAMLPSKKKMGYALPEYFIFFKPRDIVSGDCYWMSDLRDTQGKIILAAIDCTGHGVPGAFMSMAANNLLNYIVNEREVTRPDKILKLLHEEIRLVLNQKETKNRDGMDMSLVMIDYHKKRLYFAGAVNPLVYIQNKELHHIKGTRKSVGGHVKLDDRRFEQHVVPLDVPTTFYLFSDGIQDQFGGERGRKFTPRRLRELMLMIHHLPMDKQQHYVEQALNKWMKNEKQIDDILLMGVRIDEKMFLS